MPRRIEYHYGGAFAPPTQTVEIGEGSRLRDRGYGSSAREGLDRSEQDDKHSASAGPRTDNDVHLGIGAGRIANAARMNRSRRWAVNPGSCCVQKTHQKPSLQTTDNSDAISDLPRFGKHVFPERFNSDHSRFGSRRVRESRLRPA